MAEDELIEKLSSLFELHKSGALTPEEFTLLKTRIINGGGEISQQSPMETKQSSAFSDAKEISDSPNANNSKSSKYDLSYEKETGATIVGVALSLITLGLLISGIHSDPEISRLAGALTIIIRVAITIWVVDIATEQNRNSLGWGFFAFFFPGISLMIIGLLNKLHPKNNILYEQAKNSSFNPGNDNYDPKKYKYSKGEFLIAGSQIKDKVGYRLFTFKNSKYISGIPEIEAQGNLQPIKASVCGHHNGLYVKLHLNTKTYHIAIAYDEINDFCLTNNILQFQLFDNQIVKILFDYVKDPRTLVNLCNKYKQITGKTPSVASSIFGW